MTKEGEEKRVQKDKEVERFKMKLEEPEKIIEGEVEVDGKENKEDQSVMERYGRIEKESECIGESIGIKIGDIGIGDEERSQILYSVGKEADIEVEESKDEEDNEEWGNKIIEMSEEDRKTGEKLREIKESVGDVESGKDKVETGDKESDDELDNKERDDKNRELLREVEDSMKFEDSMKVKRLKMK